MRDRGSSFIAKNIILLQYVACMQLLVACLAAWYNHTVMLYQLATFLHRRFSLIALIAFVTLALFSQPALAAVKEIRNLNSANEASSKTPSLENFNANSIPSMMAVITCQGLGRAMGCEVDAQGQSVSGNGLSGSLATAMTLMYENPPADTQRYVADLMNGAGIAPPAYAQGLGFAALDPILETWKMFRNIAYLFFVIIFVVIGFMIMFRQKVGQAAVTAQQAIPQIIVALITVTFSYAIAGLLIDGMYLLMFFLVGIFGEETKLIDKNFVQLGIYMITEGFGSVDALGDFVDASLGGLGNAVAQVVEIISEVTFALIITIAILIGMFRLFFELLKTYITIIVSVAFAPVLLMLGAIPGKSNFKAWLQGLVGNLAAFPAVLVVLIIFEKIIDTRGEEGGFLPPYLFGNGSSGVIPALIGLGLLLALPEVVQKVKEALGAKDSFGWLTSAAWKGFQRGRAPAAALAGAAIGGPVGGYVGYRLGQKFADDTGLTGPARQIAMGTGTLIGTTVGARAIPVGRSIIGSTVSQARDALIRMQVEKGSVGLTTAQSQQQTGAGVNIARQQQAAARQQASSPNNTPGQGGVSPQQAGRLGP